LITSAHSCVDRYFIVIDDIWEIQTWDIIKLSIDDDNSCGGRIIVTTRKMDVATRAGKVYNLQPLPHNSSRTLFYTRLYGHEGNCVDNQPDEVCDKFLRKCDGIPLAIITIASLLVGKPREEWSELYKYIGFGLKDNEQAETTMTIVSFSYYDMPSHLRSCLVYLSAFLEDSVILKDGLIWKWIAEGFVQEKQGLRLFEVGEGYFNDLLNRSMIEAESNPDGSVYGCRIHDMVLDFIRLVSDKENFLTVSDRMDDGRGTLIKPSTVGRLSQHNRTIGYTSQANHVDMPKVRTFIVYTCVIETTVLLSSFKILRVLAIEGCKPNGGSSIRIEHIGQLLHLRYLSLLGTKIDKIPEEIGALRMLQTLELTQSYIVELPSSINMLTQLVCLHVTFSHNVDAAKEVASVGKLTSLEDLRIHFRDVKWSTRRLMKELSSLRELRVLIATTYYDEDSERDFLESLRQLPKLQTLVLIHSFDDNEIPAAKWETEFALPRRLQHLAVNGVATSVEELAAISSDERDVVPVDVEYLRDLINHSYLEFSCYLGDKFPTASWEEVGFVLPRHLRELYIRTVKFCKLPSWVSPSCPPNLTELSLYLGAVDERT
jgi:disease resistance protein RPM1